MFLYYFIYSYISCGENLATDTSEVWCGMCGIVVHSVYLVGVVYIQIYYALATGS